VGDEVCPPAILSEDRGGEPVGIAGDWIDRISNAYVLYINLTYVDDDGDDVRVCPADGGPRPYSCTSNREFFAQATMAWFNVSIRVPEVLKRPANIKRYFPELHDLLYDIYGPPSDMCDPEEGALRHCNKHVNAFCHPLRRNWRGEGAYDITCRDVNAEGIDNFYSCPSDTLTQGYIVCTNDNCTDEQCCNS
jgi:hypothetical protein